MFSMDMRRRTVGKYSFRIWNGQARRNMKNNNREKRFFIAAICFLSAFAGGIVSSWPAVGKERSEPSGKCKVVLMQAELAWGDVEENLRRFGERIGNYRGKDLIIFPELFVSGCEMKSGDKAAALWKKNEIASCYPAVLEHMKSWAAATGALIMGSTIYKEDDKFYNRLLAVYPDGRYEIYDKHNCFKKGGFSPGSGDLVVEWKGFRFATYICYDLRFPEWSRNENPDAPGESKYDAAIYIANWPASRRRDWKRLLRERALENRAYILGVNCAGEDPAGLRYAGDSRIISPRGKVLKSCRPFKEGRVAGDL